MFFMLAARRKSRAWLLPSHCILYSGRACSPVSELRCRVHKALQMSKCYFVCPLGIVWSWNCQWKVSSWAWILSALVGIIMVLSTYIWMKCSVHLSIDPKRNSWWLEPWLVYTMTRREGLTWAVISAKCQSPWSLIALILIPIATAFTASD